MKPTILQSKRLVITSRTLEEMKEVYQSETNEELKKAYLEMFDTMRALPGNNEWGCDWKISLPSGETVGGIGFKGKADKRGFVEVGYGIDEPFRCRGYATEALGAMTEWALSHNEVHAVKAETERENKASLRVISANGFLSYGIGAEGLLFVRFRNAEAPFFRHVTDFSRGTLFFLLKDAYSFDGRCLAHWDENWKNFDRFFYDHPTIADRYGFITEVGGKPIGLCSWDPRKLPAYAEIGHNCISLSYKGQGYGAVQLAEMVRRISLSDAEKINVTTNAFLIAAQRMYERVGFSLVKSRLNEGTDAFSGDYLDYEYSI